MASSLFKAEESGVLLVYSEPGQDATLEEFHDWYDNEHVPLRIKRFDEFRTAARYEVVSSDSSFSGAPAWTRSGWGALYTISSNALYNDERYTVLRSKRSAREAELLSRVAVLDRRIYALRSDTAAPGESLRARTAAEIEKEAAVVVATSVTMIDDAAQKAYDEWYEAEHIPLLQKVPGWQRTRRLQLLDALINGKQAAKDNADGKVVPVNLGLHEYSNGDFASTPEYKAALNTEWRRKVMGENDCNVKSRERKVMRLYRAWDPEVALQSSSK